MADSIKADPTITGSPGVTTSTPGTYKGLDGKSYKLGLNEMTQASGAENTLQNNRALRAYQENAAAMQLKESLSKIDRTALDAYKNVANNYAARGMQRSGGYAKADDRVYQDTQDVKLSQIKGVTDLIDQNKLQDTADEQTRNQTIQQLIAEFIGKEAGKKLNEIKG
jgi:hypothetical protein